MKKKAVFGKKEIELVKAAYSLGLVAVIPTDTIYGVTALALDRKGVAGLYKLRKRNPKKPFIILISSLSDLSLFGVELSNSEKIWLKNVWPNKLTVILSCRQKEYTYLHRGSKTLAFRMPDNKWLKELIKTVGPIVAPSANIEGEKFAETVEEAYNYFGDKAVYLDTGRVKGVSSTIVSLENNFRIIRQGGYKLKKNEYFRSDINN
jgi:L-threonylcarbamoyladenylate synthase